MSIFPPKVSYAIGKKQTEMWRKQPLSSTNKLNHQNYNFRKHQIEWVTSHCSNLINLHKRNTKKCLGFTKEWNYWKLDFLVLLIVFLGLFSFSDLSLLDWFPLLSMLHFFTCLPSSSSFSCFSFSSWYSYSLFLAWFFSALTFSLVMTSFLYIKTLLKRGGIGFLKFTGAGEVLSIESLAIELHFSTWGGAWFLGILSTIECF